MSIPEIRFRIIQPEASLFAFVESFWMLENPSDQAKEIVILPDGRFDIIFSISPGEPLNSMQMGLGSLPERNSIPPKIKMFAVSFKLPAIEYLLDMKAASLLNHAYPLPEGFWGITQNELKDFEKFCNTISAKMRTLIPPEMDGRKEKLFELIYSSGGTLSVKELSERVFWSSRQINRYFNEYFGISLKAYCNILRFKESLPHIKKGRLFPELDFADQTHFIKEVKRFSGASPKELFKNQNGRFILLSALPVK